MKIQISKSEFKWQVYIAIVLFIIMVGANILGKWINNAFEHYGDGSLIDIIEINGIFCTCYLLSSIINVRIKISYRWPLIRVLFWTFALLLLDFIARDEDSFYTLYVDVLAPINGALFAPYNSILYYLDHTLNSIFFQMFVLSTIGIAFYEFLMIEVAVFIVKKFKGTTNLNSIK